MPCDGTPRLGAGAGAGADPDEANPHGWTAAHFAAMGGALAGVGLRV